MAAGCRGTNKEMTTNPNSNPRSKSKVEEFELDEEFETKYPDITGIRTIGKVLILDHYTGAFIQSAYYNDDSIKTIKTLRNALEDSGVICAEFEIDKFLGAFGQLLVKRILQEAKEEVAQATEEQQQRDSILESISRLKEQHQNISSEEWISALRIRYQELKDVVKETMPEIWTGLEFVLSVHKILNIQGCTLPFIGIILGRPSSYKTVIIELLKGWHNTFYTDNFTARSFVSHSTSVDPEELEKIDMLPRLKGNIFLTPELSPMFTTKEEDLTQLLGIITRIADGHGYSSDSGAHGHRGYDEDIMFTWAAAAVDIPFSVFKILNNLGHRLYYYRLQFADESIDQLLEYATIGEDFNDRKRKIQTALFDYLKWFEIGPSLTSDKKMTWDYSKDDKAALRIIAGMADVLSYLRCVAQVWETRDSQGSDYAYSISQREVPRRATTALSNLARGHGLLTGRNYITLDDVQIVIKTALDSAQIERVSMFNLLLAHGGQLTTTQILQSLNVARKTVLRTMTELKAVGLVDIEDFHEPGQNNVSRRMVLNPSLSWLLTDSVITKFFPHTTSFFQGGEAEAEAEEMEDIASVFWSIYERLENGNGGTGTVKHKELHEALLSSGKFYQGDATQIIDDMVNAGRLEPVSFHLYRRISQNHEKKGGCIGEDFGNHET
jgi:hypothetical protein